MKKDQKSGAYSIRRLRLECCRSMKFLLLIAMLCCCESKGADTDKQAGNLFTNGSFELGLGAEPFYPGWSAARETCPLPEEIPPLPIIDDTQANNGKRSLKFRAIPGNGRAVIEFQTPVLPQDTQSQFSVWVRANRPGVTFTFGVCPPPFKGPLPFVSRINGKLSPEWKKFQCELPKASGVIHLRAEIFSSQNKPFDVWIDDICWTVGKHQQATRSGPVELVLLPATRNGMHFADQPVRLTWSGDADMPRNVELKLILRDLSRNGTETIAWKGKTSLSPEAKQEEIVIGKLKRGAYMAEIKAYDPVSSTLLGIGRERFTVISDLKQVAPPIDFQCGYHGGFGFGPFKAFNWRGAWSPDEFFADWWQTGFRVQRNIFKWKHVEPLEGKFTWAESSMDRYINAAARNGCTTLPCIPAYPFHLKKKDYEKIMKEDQLDDGRWLIKKSKDISESSRRSAVMGWSGNPQLREVLLAPPADALVKFCTAFAERYKDKITALEFMNESNLYINPDALLEYYFKPAYPAIKKVAPNLPVLMNQTMDYAEDGNGFTGQFFALGAMKYCDGFTHHPYGQHLLQGNGNEAVRILKQLADKYSLPNKPMQLGMTEIHAIGCRNFIRGEGVQRALLDWSIGCRWSAGVLLEGFTFYEGGFRDIWFRRGSFIPGVGAVEMNAMFAVLGGSRFLKCVELDDDTLLACFEKPGKVPLYTVAITAADYPTRIALLKADLKGLPLKAFDPCGEPMPVPTGNTIMLSPETLYLQSPDRELFRRFESGKLVWAQKLEDMVEVRINEEINEAMATGGIPQKKHVSCGLIKNWSLLTSPSPKSKSSPQESGLADNAGNLINPNRAKPVNSSQPYIMLTDKPTKGISSHYAHTVIYSDEAKSTSFEVSATGPTAIWLNGKMIHDYSAWSRRIVGSHWGKLVMPIRAGMNNIIVRVIAEEKWPCAFALKTAEASGDQSPVTVDDQGYIRKWKLIGPWNNPRNAENKFTGDTFKFGPENSPSSPDFALQAQGKMIRSNLHKQRVPLIWHEEISNQATISHPWADAVSYAYTIVEAPEAMDGVVSFGSDDGFALWINGQEIGRKSISRKLEMDSEKLPVHLRKGHNRILFKIVDTGAGGGFALRFMDKDGKPIRLKIVE